MYINSEMIIASITIGGCTGVLISLVWEWRKYKNMIAGMVKTREEYDLTHQEEADKYIIEETNITSGVELWGRKKGKFCWYPFDGEIAFNNNVAVVEGDERASNDGLRFMQELSNSIIEQKDKVCILDAGRNFENEAQKFGKEYISIASDECVCINPFSVLHEVGEGFGEDALWLISALIKMMILDGKAGEQNDNDVNMYLIKEGVKAVWKEKREKAGISDLIKWMLQSESNPRENTEYIACMLSRYGEAGQYGRYFNGKADLDLENDFNAISFDKVEEVRKVLIAGVLTYIHVKGMQYGVKSYKGVILRDLIGDFKNKADKIFIEGYLRTQRLHRKGVISNINPDCEIFKLTNELCDSTCCMSHDKKAIERLAEKSFLWGSAKKIGQSSYKYPEYLIAANKILKRIDKETKYTIEDSIPYLLRGNLKERGHA